MTKHAAPTSLTRALYRNRRVVVGMGGGGEMGHIDNTDWLVVVGYFVAVFGVAIWATVREADTRKTSAGYFLAGRNVGWFVIGASLFASNIGSEHLVGLAGTAAASGLAVGQFEILASLILLALGWVFVPFYLKSGVFTMPEFLERRYSSAARWYLAVVSIVGYVLTKISVTIAAGGIVFESLMGIDFWTGALVVVIATGIYTIFGGLRAVLYTDMLQMFVLVGGAVAVTVTGISAIGGWNALVDTAGISFFDLWKPISDPNFPWTGILFGAPILGVWYWCTDQFIVQRVLSASDENNARRGTIFGGYLKLLPLFIFVLPGVVAYALAKTGRIDLAQPDEALPTLIGALLPSGLRGLVVAGLLAALMSSLSSVFNSCSTLITWDIYKKLRPQSSERRLVWIGQASTVVLVAFGLMWIPMMHFISGQLYQYLQSVQAYIAPPIAAVFLIGLVWRRANARGAIASLVVGFVLGITRLVLELNREALEGPLLWVVEINFLHFAIILFLICAGVLIGVSAVSPARSDEKLVGLTFATIERATEPKPRSRWRSRDLAASALLCGLVALIWIYFNQPDAEAPPPEAANPRVERLVDAMTLEEKLGQLTQYAGVPERPLADAIKPEHLAAVRRGEVGSFLSVNGAALGHDLQRIAVEESRLGIPLLLAFDVIHGFRTTFPVPLAEACSWDPLAVQKSARVAASEAAAAGIHWTFAPMVDIARDPRWGRIVEGAGEDPFLGAVMAAARVRGFQGEDLAATDTLLACAKHFAAYGAAEGGRDYNTVDLSQRTLRSVYLPPFRAAVDAGVATLMSGFNEIGGVPATASHFLQTEILRDEWHFTGFVVSDWESVSELIDHGVATDRAEAGRLALEAGVAMEMVSGTYLADAIALVRAGAIPMTRVDNSVRRVLSAKLALGLLDDPYRYDDPERERLQILSAEHRAAAREVAGRSIVLLKNADHTLPFPQQTTVAVIGPLADDATSALGPWATPGKPEDAITPLHGIEDLVGEGNTLYARGCTATGKDTSGIAAAVATARRADRVVLVLGETATMSGEAASRSDISLPGVQRQLAAAILALHLPTVVVLMNGRPLAIPELDATAPAILETWFLGIETGHAVADVLFGAVNPGGKLATTFPRAVGQVPIYYAAKNTGRPADADTKWSSKYIDLDITPLYPFGHGLSYTRFAYADLRVTPSSPSTDDTLRVSFTLTNVGARAGDEVAQLYARDRVGSTTPSVQQLRGFRRITLQPGEKARVTFALPLAAMGLYDPEMRYVVEPGAVDLMVGASSADIRLRTRVSLDGERRVSTQPPILANRVEVKRLGIAARPR